MKSHRSAGIALYGLLLFFLINLCVFLLCGCSNDKVSTPDNDQDVETEEAVTPEADKENEMTGISITETLIKTWEELDASEWEVAFISNTGVTQSYTAEGIRSPMEALLSPDGKAGQWVVELYKDEPEPFSDGEREGIGYPFQTVLVTSQSVSLLPETTLGVPTQLVPLKKEYIEAFPQALKSAVENLNIEYDRISVLSNFMATGEFNWVFRFYDISKQQIIALVLVSGDGQNIDDILIGDELDEFLN